MKSRLLLLILAGALLACPGAWAAANIVILNADDPGVGFNDPTPVAPVGGNTGTTLGEQRLIAFQAAAARWGANLNSAVTIEVYAYWTALPCTATSATLGSAGATRVYANFDAGVPDRWYGFALANKLAGEDLDDTYPEILAKFNYNLGNPGCLTGTYWYLGLDGAHGSNVDLVTVLQHELAHGLGFQTFTNGSTGALLGGLYPSIWDDFSLDTSTNKVWSAMTNAERAASAINTRRLVWTGANVSAAVPSVLALGTPQLMVSAPAGVAGTYLVGTATFGPPLSSPGVTAEVMPVVDTAPNLGLACTALSALNARAVSGKIALVDRGVCGFTTKALNVQAAGAVGVIVADNAAGSPPPGLGGTDPSVVIPAVRITQADGAALKYAMRTRTRTHSGLFATMWLNPAVPLGADAAGRALLFTPNPFVSGSSVSHYDTSASPNQLMEPSITADLTHEVTPPTDMTTPLLFDVGWN